jgi:hypothetical protein
MYKIMIPMVFALISVVFLGSGITGFAVSETCCTGVDCPADRYCNVSGKEKQETGTASVLLSAGFLFISMLSYLLLNKAFNKHHA